MSENLAVIWDLDETIIKSKDITLDILSEVFPMFGIVSPTREALSGTYGASLEEFLKMHSNNHDDHDKIVSTFLEVQPKYYENVQLHDGVIDAVKFFAANGLKQAVLTNRGNEGRGVGGAREIVKSSGLIDYIDLTICSDDMTSPKPHPEGVLLALKSLKTELGNATMIGDQDIDMLAAKQAGIYAVGVVHSPDYLNAELLTKSGADIVTYSIKAAKVAVAELFDLDLV